MTDLPFALSECSMGELQSWHRRSKRNGWHEILHDVREEMQRRADRDGPSDTIAGP